ncbi:hypothetical protein [Marinilactibacillus psychrotolerans]|uniref:DUF4352 domain-containing protein n=1 Tax=Marinilactibacillus psychrotolerans TaxID=191770 RepID=A0AAV3WR99_9LACT|nr:hypothetical protein [Marinilactibacillus psychrotolerans]GEL67206.1 hypothetical protein MPS01_13610 [Marinilactibacillus psychrotolerans]GEQ36010.1 hypothetical protein M132T_15180 [Marinilactibacillus psychrotolerans]SDC59587.1 hypothetical protein SAMN04488013_10722 [Marinilactibacillus psychrotolerans]
MKTKLALLSLSGLLLIGCGDETVDNTGKESEAASSSEVVENKKEDPKDEMLVTGGPLLEPGQYKNDEEFGRIELLKITSPGNENEIAPGLFLTLKDVKVLNFEDIPEENQEYAEAYYGFKDSQGYQLQFEYTVDNQNDYSIDNTVIEKIILSDGEQVTRDMYLDETFELEANSKASGQIGGIEVPTPDIDSATFYINPYDTENYEQIETTPVKVEF